MTVSANFARTILHAESFIKATTFLSTTAKVQITHDATVQMTHDATVVVVVQLLPVIMYDLS